MRLCTACPWGLVGGKRSSAVTSSTITIPSRPRCGSVLCGGKQLRQSRYGTVDATTWLYVLGETLSAGECFVYQPAAGRKRAGGARPGKKSPRAIRSDRTNALSFRIVARPG